MSAKAAEAAALSTLKTFLEDRSALRQPTSAPHALELFFKKDTDKRHRHCSNCETHHGRSSTPYCTKRRSPNSSRNNTDGFAYQAVKAAEDGMKDGIVKAGHIDRLIKDLTPYYKQQTDSENASSSSASSISASNSYDNRNSRQPRLNHYGNNTRSTSNNHGRGQHHKNRERRDSRDRGWGRDRHNNHRDRDGGRSQAGNRGQARSHERKDSQDRDRENNRNRGEHKNDHNRQHSQDHHNESKDNHEKDHSSQECSADRRKRPLRLDACTALSDALQEHNGDYEAIHKTLYS